jgi:hypothetical protein
MPSVQFMMMMILQFEVSYLVCAYRIIEYRLIATLLRHQKIEVSVANDKSIYHDPWDKDQVLNDAHLLDSRKDCK